MPFPPEATAYETSLGASDGPFVTLVPAAEAALKPLKDPAVSSWPWAACRTEVTLVSSATSVSGITAIGAVMVLAVDPQPASATALPSMASAVMASAVDPPASFHLPMEPPHECRGAEAPH